MPTERVACISTSALFDWGMGLGAALYCGHPQGAPRLSDPEGRPPSS